MPQGNNLFSVDENEIERLLTEANSAWLKECAALVDDVQAVPEEIRTTNDLDLAKKLVKQLHAGVKRTRSERISDQKPFKGAVEKIKSFYEDVETSLKLSLETLLKRLASAVQTSERASGVVSDASTVVFDNAGNAIGTGASGPVKLGSGIKLVWAVKSVDRETVDLELLRDHFAESALLSACKKLLEEEGPKDIAGIEYEKVAKPK